MNRGANALAIFLLLTGALVAVAPVTIRKVDAQGTTQWYGTLGLESYSYSSYTGGWTADAVEASWSFSFAVSSGGLSGLGEGSSITQGTYSYQPPNTANFTDSISISGAASSTGHSATLSFSAEGCTPTGCAPLLFFESGSFSPSPFPFSVDLTDGFVGIYHYAAFCGGFAFPDAFPSFPTSCSIQIKLHSRSHTVLSCSPQDQLVGRSVNCEADVFGNNPTGTVTFTATSDKVSLTPYSCQLMSDPYGGPFSFCQVPFSSPSEGDFNVTARYNGDSNNPSTDDSKSVTFVKLEPGGDLSLSCDPSILNQNLHANCMATVSLGVPQPTGNVTWSATNPARARAAGVFSNSTCVLPHAAPLRCGVTYFQGNASEAATITATYLGDAYHHLKQASSTITVLAVGVGTLDQRQTTGFVIKMNGTSGSVVSATSTYSYAQPNGTGKPPFASNGYYDLKVAGPINGGVQVCHYGANVNATTSIDYYYNGIWTAATNIVANAGVGVCGDILASALRGTPLDIGGSSSSVTTMTSSTSATTAAASTSPTSSLTTTTSSASTSSTTSTSSGGGGIPEFPYQASILVVTTLVILGSYFLIRRQGSLRKARMQS